MSLLVSLIDDYRDAHGQPSEASIARAVGVAPQTLNSWRQRGLKEPPAVDTMRRLADFLRVDYVTVVLRAALIDSGWMDDDEAWPGPDAADVG